MKSILLPFLILVGCTGQSQLSKTTSSEKLLSYTDFITPEYLESHLQIIANDSLQGRASGSEGQKMAADYLANVYTQLGIPPKGDDGTYFQKFELNAEFTDSLVYRTRRHEQNDTVEIDHSVEAKGSGSEYIRVFGGTEPINADVVFVGFGVDDPEREVFHLEGTELQNKWVLMFEEIPYILDGDTLVNPDISTNNRLREILVEHNAAGILLISDYTSNEFDELVSVGSDLISKPSNISLRYLEENPSPSEIPKAVVQISPEMAARFLELSDEDELNRHRESLVNSITEFRAEETSFSLDFTPYDGPGYLETENVLGYLEGADPELKDEVLVLMAHYDHVGVSDPDSTGDTIYNGADDNGSGTSALLAIAQALSQAKADGYQPKRSVLFLHVAAEEMGLLGSRYYSDHPVIPIENTVTNFNTDMIGRSDSRNIEQGDTDYVYLIGGEIISSELDSLVQSANNQSVNMRLDRYYNDLQDRNQFYRRSDHWNFGRLSVPFVFFFTGVHEDYHRPSDSVDKIDFEKLARVTQLIYSSTIEVTNYDGRPAVDNEEFIEITKSLPR